MTNPKEVLLAQLSEYLDSALSSKDKDYQEQVQQLKQTHQQEIDHIMEISSQELMKLKNKISTYAQTEDTNKFQKRTITSLTAEISAMQTTITSLEKRLKLATDEIRSLKKNTKMYQPSPPVKDEPAPVLKDEPVPEPVLKDEPAPEPVLKDEPVPEPVLKDEPAAEPVLKDEPAPEPVLKEPEVPSSPIVIESEQNDSPELLPVVLKSGSYYWDPESNDLYEFITEEEAGGVVGLIKSIKIKGKIYYLDTADNSFYEITDTIGQCMGQIIDRKAVFYRS